MPYYRNYQGGGQVDPGLIKNWFAEKYGADSDAIEGLIGQISKVESDNRNIPQIGGGPGRGLFQFETKDGSGAFQSALTRTATLYGKLGKKVPTWVENARKPTHSSYDDATKLSKERQEEVLLADLAMKEVQDTPGLGDELIRKALESGSAKDLWLQAHWAGKEEDRSGKSKYWDEKFQSGGPVTEQNTDTVPAMLTPGEFVIRKDAADQIGPEKLNMLNNIDRLSGTALLENAKSPMGYQKGGLVGMLGDFIKGQKETWGRAKAMEEETGVRNPFLRTEEEQLAQMQKTGSVPKGGWLEKKLAQASADNPELEGPSRPEVPFTPAEIGGGPEPEFGMPLGYQMGEGDPGTEKAYIESLIGASAPRPAAHISALTSGIEPTKYAYLTSLARMARPGEVRGESGTADLPTLDPEANLSEDAMAALATERAYKESMLNPPGESVWWGSQGRSDLGIRGEAGSGALANLSQLAMAKPTFADPRGGLPMESPYMATEGEGPDIVGDFDLAAMPEPTGGIADWGEAPPIPVSEEGFDVAEFHRGSKDPYKDKEKLGVLEWLSNILGGKQGSPIHGYQEGGEVMNYQNGGQMNDVLSIFGEKSKQGDEMQKLMAMAAMQQMQRAQQVQQAIGMQGGGYADEYQQGGTVEPPMSRPESGPQEAPLPGGDQTYHQPPMEQLDMDQYEYASYVEHGPDMYKWMAPKYKSKQQWTPYDAMVDAGTIDPYEIDKDELNVVTNDQLEALSNQARESMRV